MKNACFVLIGFLATAAFADLTPTTILDDVPGDTTIANLVAASGGGGGGSGGGGLDTNAVEVIANKAVETNALTRALAARTGADITTGGDYEPFGYTHPDNDISFNIIQLDGGIVDTGDRIDEIANEAWEAFALKEESVANQDGEANDLTVNGLTVNDTAKFIDNVEIGSHNLYIDGSVFEDILDGYTKRRLFDDLEDEFEAHRDNTNIHVKASEKAAWNAKLDKSDVIDPASATTTGKAADALAVKNALAAKAESSDVYAKAEVDAKLSGKRDLTDRSWGELHIKPECLPITNDTGVTQSYDWSSHSVVESVLTPGSYELLDANGAAAAVINPNGTVFDGDRILFNGESLYRGLSVAEADTLALTSEVTASVAVEQTRATTAEQALATDLNNKASRAANPTAGNLAALDANGNPTDSGVKPSDYQTREQVLAITDPLDLRVRKLEGFVRTFAQLKEIIDAKVAETGKTDEEKIAELKDELVGVEIPDRWANTGGTVYEDPMIVINVGKFKGEDEELHIGALLMRKYACVESIVFDMPEIETTTDTVADGVHFYYGLAQGKTSPTAADLTCLFDTATVGGVRTNTPWAAGTDLNAASFSKIYKNSIGDHTKSIFQYGWNNWKFSAYRQYLNSDVAKGTSWWDKNFAWDVAALGERVGNMAPSNATTVRGYKQGCSGHDSGQPGLLTYVKPVYIKTWKNYVTDGATSAYRAEDVYETLDTFFLPSGADLYGNVNLNGGVGVEGELSPYFKAATGYSSPNNAQNAGRIRYAESNKSTGTTIRLRSAYRGYSYYAWYSYATGSVSNTAASNAYASSPACVIY